MLTGEREVGSCRLFLRTLAAASSSVRRFLRPRFGCFALLFAAIRSGIGFLRQPVPVRVDSTAQSDSWPLNLPVSDEISIQGRASGEERDAMRRLTACSMLAADRLESDRSSELASDPFGLPLRTALS